MWQIGITTLLLYITTTHGYMPYQCGDIQIPHIPYGIEKCYNDIETGAELNDVERDAMVDAANMYRGMIANGCDKFFKDKPKSIANYPKMTYNCQYEADAKFECPAKKEDFKTSGWIYRGMEEVTASNLNKAVLWRLAPNVSQTYISSSTQVAAARETLEKRPIKKILSLLLNPFAIEIGCFARNCAFHGRAFNLIACKNGQAITGEGPLYPAGNRCQSDTDCTLPGFSICDREFGLCEKPPVVPPEQINVTTPAPTTPEHVEATSDPTVINPNEQPLIINITTPAPTTTERVKTTPDPTVIKPNEQPLVIQANAQGYVMEFSQSIRIFVPAVSIGTVESQPLKVNQLPIVPNFFNLNDLFAKLGTNNSK